MRYPIIAALLTGLALATAPIKPAFAQKGIFAKKNTAPTEAPSLTKTYSEDLTDPLPVYAGGPDELRKFLAEHVIIPPFALANELAGGVDVEFVLRPDGQIDSVQVSHGACCGLDEEAIRVARLTAGKWTPGRIEGVPVNARVDLPVTFRVANKNSRSAAYYKEMKAKYATYLNSNDYVNDQKKYEEQIAKQMGQ